ncbi:MAG: hypothetical protein U1C19_10335 [Methanobacteriaceae archaeon]|nr:hypothetical protein [Methanobacteriaceae archaeon]
MGFEPRVERVSTGFQVLRITKLEYSGNENNIQNKNVNLSLDAIGLDFPTSGISRDNMIIFF